ncbi:MAG: hypothetical protein M0030_10530 [Actinomycetota bacterium]|nr:hypothetical protein [Actinomycetota bacterium]
MAGETDAGVLPGPEPEPEPVADTGAGTAVLGVAALGVAALGVAAPVTGVVPWWRRALVIAAAVIAAATTSWLAGQSPVGLVGIVAVGLTLLPAVARADSFGRSVLGVAIVLFLLAIAGMFLALFVYLPVAAVLLLVWLADPAARPRTAPYTAAFGAAFCALLVIVWTVEIHRAF